MEELRVLDQVRRCRNHPSAQIAGSERCSRRRCARSALTTVRVRHIEQLAASAPV